MAPHGVVLVPVLVSEQAGKRGSAKQSNTALSAISYLACRNIFSAAFASQRPRLRYGLDIPNLLLRKLALVREAEAFAQTAVLVQDNIKGSNRRSLAATSTEYSLLRAKLHTCTPDQPLASAMYHGLYQHTDLFC